VFSPLTDFQDFLDLVIESSEYNISIIIFSFGKEIEMISESKDFYIYFR